MSALEYFWPATWLEEASTSAESTDPYCTMYIVGTGVQQPVHSHAVTRAHRQIAVTRSLSVSVSLFQVCTVVHKQVRTVSGLAPAE